MTNLEITIIVTKKQADALIAMAKEKETTPSYLCRDIIDSYLANNTGIKKKPPAVESLSQDLRQEIDDEKRYSVAEVSAYLGLSQATVRKYAQDEKIPAHKVKRIWVFLGKDIKSYQCNLQSRNCDKEN